MRDVKTPTAHPFEFGDSVVADGDRDNKMVVVGILYAKDAPVSVQCAYWVNGDLKDVWIPEWRLRLAEK